MLAIDCAAKASFASRNESGAVRLAARDTASASIIKVASFLARAAHAGDAPWGGVNSLKAAMLGVFSMEFLREVIRDEDMVRIHTRIRPSESGLTVVPAVTTLEMMIRARTSSALEPVSDRVDRCLEAGGTCPGCRIDY